jgi:hypothetical protein
MPRKPIDPDRIDWNTVESTLDGGKTNFKTLGKLTGVSSSTIRRLMLSRYGTRIALKRGRAVGGTSWATPDASVPTPTPVETTETAEADGNPTNG